MSVARIGAALALLVLVACNDDPSPTMADPTPATGLRLEPSALQFPATAVGAISYAMVTITNGETDSQKLVGFQPVEAPFWSTQAGTCNLEYAFVMPPGASCTLQWGFKPLSTGAQTASGIISFESGKTLTVALSGVGT